MRKEFRLTVRSPRGVSASATVHGPVTFHLALGPDDELNSLNRRLPLGRYRVTAERSTGPIHAYDGHVFVPVFSRRTFRITRDTHRRTYIWVGMRDTTEPAAIRATVLGPTRVSLNWTLPIGTTGVVRRNSGGWYYPPLDLTEGVGVSGPSTTRRALVDTVPENEGHGYALFVRTSIGSWVRLATTRVSTPAVPPPPPPPPIPVEEGTISRISVSSAGAQTDGDSASSDVSTDGRFVTFVTSSSTLAPGTSTDRQAVYLRDRVEGTTTLVSPAAATSSTPTISGDGRWIAYLSAPAGQPAGLLLYDRLADASTAVTPTLEPGDETRLLSGPQISADGSRIGFTAYAAAEGTTRTAADVYVQDLRAGTTTRVSGRSGGPVGSSFGAALSADGGVVAYRALTQLGATPAYDLYQVFVHDQATGTTRLVSHTPAGAPGDGKAGEVRISDDASTVVFTSASDDLVTGDTNLAVDAFAYDVATGAVTRISGDRDLLGTRTRYQDAATITVSGDGRLVAYVVEHPWSAYSGGYLVDRMTNGTSLIVRPGEWSDYYRQVLPTLSADGTTVAFTSYSTDLVPDDTNARRDIFVLDRRPG